MAGLRVLRVLLRNSFRNLLILLECVAEFGSALRQASDHALFVLLLVVRHARLDVFVSVLREAVEEPGDLVSGCGVGFERADQSSDEIGIMSPKPLTEFRSEELGWRLALPPYAYGQVSAP